MAYKMKFYFFTNIYYIYEVIIMNKQNKLFYSIKELCDIIPLSKSALYSAVDKGTIPCKRIGNRILIPVSYVKQLAQ